MEGNSIFLNKRIWAPPLAIAKFDSWQEAILVIEEKFQEMDREVLRNCLGVSRKPRKNRTALDDC